MRIAYIEDNATNQALVERIARMTTHIIVNYTEGEEALEALRREHYDLILMDVELAGVMSGLQVIQTLREEGLTTPIIALTAYAMMGDRDRMLAAGCEDYLPKPLPINDFLAMLTRYDAKLKGPAAAPTASPAPLVGAKPAEPPAQTLAVPQPPAAENTPARPEVRTTATPTTESNTAQP